MMGYRRLSDAERVDWLRLAGTEHVGPISFFQLVDRFGSAREALAAGREIVVLVADDRAVLVSERMGTEALSEEERERLGLPGRS